ncbi:hypothetical protein Fmac_001982 [Flemingia macrophylla]|uniref:Replication factor A C-terminal domain-containing protein n=1 Tax=Flemingia macrophylla TaxID=520843 RepID=A0ABD1NIL9_9FABA
MIMILTQARVKEGTTIYATSISNSWHGSKVLINEVMPEIVEFKARFTSLQINDDVSGESQQLTQMTQGSSLMSEQEKFLYKAAVKSISEINALKEDATIVTIGIIGNFVVGKSGWYYLSCSNCFKKSESNIAYRCSCGTYNENLIPRYKLEAKVYHGKDSANFIFWDRDCTCLIGKSALKLRDLMIECGEDDPKIFPEPLDDTLARTLAYRAKYQVAYNSISVSKVSDDAEFIKVLKEQMCCNEVIRYLTIHEMNDYFLLTCVFPACISN